MQSTRKINRGLTLRATVLAGATFITLSSNIAHARGSARFLDVSLTGSLSKDIQQFVTSSRQSLGLEIGLPLTDIFDLAIGHTTIIDRDEYNEAYREAKKEQGVNLPEGTIEQKTLVRDTSVNASIGHSFGYVKPTLFGGALWRRSCLEDTFQDYGCTNQKATWNAGLAISAYITLGTRFRVSYRLSPSVHQSGVKKNYDELVSIGLTWSL